MRSQRWKMSAMWHEGEAAARGWVYVYVWLFGYVTPAVLLDSGGGEEDIIHHQETVLKKNKKKKLLPSRPVMWELWCGWSLNWVVLRHVHGVRVTVQLSTSSAHQRGSVHSSCLRRSIKTANRKKVEKRRLTCLKDDQRRLLRVEFRRHSRCC